MSYLKYSDMIGVRKPMTYSEFFQTVSESYINLLSKTNEYGKASTSLLLENEDNYSETKEYEHAITAETDTMLNAYDRIVNDEYNRILTRINTIQNTVQPIMKSVLTTVLPDIYSYNTYENIFKPNLNILNDAIQNPDPVALAFKALGANKVPIDADKINSNKSKLIELLGEIERAILKNKSDMQTLMYKGSDVKELDKAITIENEMKVNIEGYKAVNQVYDSYLNEIQFLLNEFIRVASDGNVEVKNMDDLPPDERDIIDVSSDSIDNKLDDEIIYDNTQADGKIINFNNKVSEIEATMENAVIKANAMNKSMSDSVTAISNGFTKTALDNLIMCSYRMNKLTLNETSNIWLSIRDKMNLYDKWIQIHEAALNNINADELGIDCVMTEWSECGVESFKPSDQPISIPEPNYELNDETKESMEGFVSDFNSAGGKDTITKDIVSNVYNIPEEKSREIVDKEELIDTVKETLPEPNIVHVTESVKYQLINNLKDVHKDTLDLLMSNRLDSLNTQTEAMIESMTQDEQRLYLLDESSADLIMRSWSALSECISGYRNAVNTIFNINYNMINTKAMESYNALRDILTANTLNTSSVTESIDLSAEDYIELANLSEDMSEPIFGIVTDKEIDPQQLLSDPIPDKIRLEMENNKLYPVNQMNDGSLLMKSMIDGNVWRYNPVDTSLVCQNTLNSICV